ncbi:PLP-dependent aminotransferase family protein [Pendulispora albinea]|uniref:PLP-dependent aminotransferase family protein n=1 Tax=Pendulispora albinea TaxID=2741071 RepID=A0ABZ2M4V0_9BACT
MARRQTSPLVTIVRTLGDDPAIHRRIADALRTAIAQGTLQGGARLPSTRTLASDLGVSRTTVEAAFAQLDAEGLLVRRVGSGTFVSETGLERESAPRPAPAPAGARTPTAAPKLSQRGHHLVAYGRATAATSARTFAPCVSNLDAFPFAVWNRLLGARARRSSAALSAAIEPAGLRALREAVADYVGSSRGVRCTYENVLIATSTQHVLDLSARVLLDPGDRVWLEDPGYLGARSAFAAAGARLVPVPVDARGLSVSEGIARAPDARLAYVTPSYQYPLGITMSLERRTELLAWAAAAGAWIFEDDYDSEFRFSGQPLAAIKGTDAHDHVLYAGTFNKVMFPSLRLAYLVAPVDIIDALVIARSLSDGPVAALTQATMADFMTEGHFAAHIRSTRTFCEERRDALVDSVARELAGAVSIARTETGMHCVGWLPQGTDDAVVSQRASTRGLDMPPLSRYFLGRDDREPYEPRDRRALHEGDGRTAPAVPTAKPGLVMSYCAATPAEIRSGIRTLARCLG